MSQNIIPPGRRQTIKKLIEEKNKALTIDELIKYTGIKKDKVRQTLTNLRYGNCQSRPGNL